jgi:hypothetical protein
VQQPDAMIAEKTLANEDHHEGYDRIVAQDHQDIKQDLLERPNSG